MLTYGGNLMDKKLQAKDLINVGIFTAIYFVIFFAGMMLGYIPIFIPLLGFVCPILCGIPFMLYLTKVKKFGMVSLSGIILGLLNLLIGSGVLVLVFGVVFGIVADLIMKAGKYSSWKCTLLGNGVFSLWIMGFVSRMFLTRTEFFDLCKIQHKGNTAENRADKSQQRDKDRNVTQHHSCEKDDEVDCGKNSDVDKVFCL